MKSLIFTIAAILLALGALEGVAYWWMHPAPGGLREPVLVYRPGSGGGEPRSKDQETRAGGQGLEVKDQEQPITQKLESTQNSESIIQNSSTPTFTHTLLPEIYEKAAPMLRCSSGRVFHTRLDDHSGIHLAFFEWDGTDTGSVLEAFRHMPEACMGSIGMKLVSREKQIPYQIGSETLLFDHTLFREGGGLMGISPPIHAFRAVWVSGVSAADARKGLGGNEFDRLRTIRIKSARDRFRPAQARVIQGAVRGITDPDLAWAAFEKAMLKDLSFAVPAE